MSVTDRQTRIRFGAPWSGAGVVNETAPAPVYATELGMLFEGDSLEVLPHLHDDSVDTVFADPPFNLGKPYGDKFDDRLPDADYVPWCKHWLDECIRVLKPGGALFVYNLPKWNILIGAHLMHRHMTFRHDVAISIKASLPIAGRLYPAHYSLLYFTKGKPKTFRRIRTPIETCRHCGREIKDYGGHEAVYPRAFGEPDLAYAQRQEKNGTAYCITSEECRDVPLFKDTLAEARRADLPLLVVTPPIPDPGADRAAERQEKSKDDYLREARGY